MKYSEAIRLGSMLKPQNFDGNYRGETYCANQAATAAAGFSAVHQFPLARVSANCPVCGKRNYLASVVAICLNDEHRWTRQQIADWVALQEDSFLHTEVSGQETHPTEVSSSVAS